MVHQNALLHKHLNRGLDVQYCEPLSGGQGDSFSVQEIADSIEVRIVRLAQKPDCTACLREGKCLKLTFELRHCKRGG